MYDENGQLKVEDLVGGSPFSGPAMNETDCLLCRLVGATLPSTIFWVHTDNPYHLVLPAQYMRDLNLTYDLIRPTTRPFAETATTGSDGCWGRSPSS